jgi:hypothetical protein
MEMEDTVRERSGSCSKKLRGAADADGLYLPTCYLMATDYRSTSLLYEKRSDCGLRSAKNSSRVGQGQGAHHSPFAHANTRASHVAARTQYQITATYCKQSYQGSQSPIQDTICKPRSKLRLVSNVDPGDFHLQATPGFDFGPFQERRKTALTSSRAPGVDLLRSQVRRS